VNGQLQSVISLLNMKVDSLERHLRLKQATIRLLEERAGIVDTDTLAEPDSARSATMGQNTRDETKSSSYGDVGAGDPLSFPEEYGSSLDANILFMQGRMAGFV